MKVALLTREYPPAVYGGAGVHVEYLARELATLVDVGVHCFGAPRADPLVEGTYEPWAALSGDDPLMPALRHLSADLAMVAGAAGSDLVHSHTWYANFAGHLAKLAYGVPHVVTAHSLEPLRPWKAEQLGSGYALSRFAERTAVEAADAVVAVSGQMRSDVLGCYPAVDPERVTVIHNGIDTDEYAPDPGTDVLERLGIDPGRPSVVFVGRITRQKGVVHVLDAAAHIDPDAQVVLCAGAPDTPAIAGEVRTRVEALRTRRDVVWIGQMLPRAEVVQILSHATVFCCPSVYEPFGLVNVEAMACEAAVVASAVGGIPEIVLEGVTGHLVPLERGQDPSGSPADPDRFARDLAAAINPLVAAPERARELGRAGRTRVIEHFGWSAVARRTVALYERLMGG